MRCAWAHIVYHRASRLLMVLTHAPRVFLFALLLYDLTSFRGDYLAQVIGVHNPSIPAALDVLMGLIVTAAFVLPFTAIGLEAVSPCCCRRSFAAGRRSAWCKPG
ncbi:MAG: hypothetical protein HND48_13705 [Chloroflexi bacterium]|nr:hypothetical protein [Chloroflexota bacterium]